MRWIWLLVVLAAALIGLFVIPRRRKAGQVDKYVCDICHGTDCECRRQDSKKR